MVRVVAHRQRRKSYQLNNDNAAGLSSQQIWDSLNGLLAFALEPVFAYTEYGFDLRLSLISASMDKRRRVSIYQSEDCRAILFHSLLYTSDDTSLLTLLQKMGVERNLLIDPVIDALAHKRLPAAMLADSPFSEDALLRHIEQAIEPYMDFRRQVSERYVRLAESLGKKNAWLKSEHGLVSDPREHVNNYMLSVLRAIDKFYPWRGTLSSYITTWMNNARGSAFSVFLGEAYSVPKSRRKALADGGEQGLYGNFALPLEEAAAIEEENEGETQDSQKMLAQLYHMPHLFPAMLEAGFPVTLSAEGLTALGSVPGVELDPAMQAYIFGPQHVAVIADNVNFDANKRERKRRDKK